MKISVILTCWKRFNNLERIIKVFLEEPEVDEIMVWDNSGGWKTELPIILINSNVNLGANAKYFLSPAVKNDIVLFCDDDILPKKGVVADLLKYYTDNTALGIYGRNFAGSYKKGEHIYAEKIQIPQSVEHIVGYLLMMPKKLLLGFDYHNFPWYCGEVKLLGSLTHSHNIKKIIVPTDKFENLAEGKDEHALCLHPDASEEYERIWKKYFQKEK